MKRITIFLLLFLASSVGAADFLDSFSEYRAHVKRKLGIATTNTTYVSDSSFNQFVREAVVAVVPVVGADKEIKVTTSSYRQMTYTLDTQVVKIHSVRWSKNDSTKSLLFVPMEVWYEQEHKSTTNQQKPHDKRPSYYFYTDTQLFVHPPPVIVGDTFRILATLKVKDIAAAADLAAVYPKYRVALLNYVAWKVAESRQHPMTNMFKADYDVALAELNGVPSK
jgi:hypothetical protein